MVNICIFRMDTLYEGYDLVNIPTVPCLCRFISPHIPIATAGAPRCARSVNKRTDEQSTWHKVATMSAPTDTTTELMTEHLQYAPLTLVDDVINSANAVLYQAMDAFETYLRETTIPAIPTATSSSSATKAFDLDASNDSERDALYTELEFGMAQVETLLENAVDRNFDAFELYVLRNVFNVPDDVDGYLRLRHHLVPPLPPAIAYCGVWS